MSDFKANLITAIRAGREQREQAFRYFETQHAERFKGMGGFAFYSDLEDIVKEAGVPEALTEYQQRFLRITDTTTMANAMMNALEAEVRDRQTQHADDMEAKLRAGGQEAVSAFLTLAEPVFDELTGRPLVQWIHDHFSALAQPDQLQLLTILLAHFFESQKKG